MPTYSYTCKNGHRHEETRPMGSEQQTKRCPECQSALIRSFDAPSITFKGGGFNASRG